MAKTKAEIEQEYQDVLKVSTSLVGAHNKMIDDTAASQGKISDAAKKYNENLKSIISSAEEEGDINDAIVKLQKEKNLLADKYFGANKRLLPQKQAEVNLAISALKAEQSKLEIIGMVDNAAQELTSTLDSSLDGILSGLDNIPVLGGLLSSIAKGPVDTLKSELGGVAKRFVTDFGGALKNGKGAMEALSVAGSGAMSSLSGLSILLNPVALAIVAIGAALAVGIARFKAIDAAAAKFREQTGLLASQTQQTQRNIQYISRDMARLGVSAEDVGSAAASFTEEFEGLEQPSRGVLESMVVLNKNFGISNSEGARLNKTFQNMAGISAEQAQILVGQTAQMAKMAGVAPSKVLKDMSESSESAYKYFSGSPEKLMKAAVQAAKLGTSIQQTADVADSLLDFESSITNELEASALLGQSLDLSQARYLASVKDSVGAQQAVLDEVAKLGDLNQMSIWQQEALAKATGMSIDDMTTQLNIKKRFSEADKEELAAAQALVSAGKDINSLTEADLRMQASKMASQQEMQSNFDEIGNQVSGLATGFSDMFAPLGEFMAGNLLDNIKQIGLVLMPIMNGIGSVFGIVFDILGGIFDVINMILTPIFMIGGAIINGFMKPLARVREGLAPIFDKLGEIKNAVVSAFEPIMPVFEWLGEAIYAIMNPIFYIFSWVFDAIGGLIDVFGFLFGIIGQIGSAIWKYIGEPISNIVGFFSDMISNIAGVFTSIGEKIQSFFMGLLPGWAQNLLSGETESDTASVQEQAAVEVAGSINDGIVQDGKIITTNPEDTIMATQESPMDMLGNMLKYTPLGLLGQAAGGIGEMASNALSGIMGGGGDAELIAEIRGLRADLASGKIAVNMDGKKVTSSVSKVVDRSSTNSYSSL